MGLPEEPRQLRPETCVSIVGDFDLVFWATPAYNSGAEDENGNDQGAMGVPRVCLEGSKGGDCA